jgi:inner membrane protein
VDPLTHGLASFTLQRALFPRVTWRTALAIIVAGSIADLDWFTASLGPGGYLRWHRTATHSLLFVAALAFLVGLFRRVTRARQTGASWMGLSWIPVAVAATLHLALDALQADAIAPLWPFSGRRFSFDLLPATDPWILALLAAAILIPELLRLVSDEIGSRSKAPRGRNGAIAALVLVVMYVGLRSALHNNAVAYLANRSIAGESPRRAAAFPDSLSPLLWHAVVETESTLNLITVRSTGAEVTDAAGATTLHKPEPSAILSAAQSSPAGVIFLRTARFPKATTQKETAQNQTEGFSAEIVDLKDQALEEKSRSILADINLDQSGAVVSSELQWRDQKK